MEKPCAEMSSGRAGSKISGVVDAMSRLESSSRFSSANKF